jgi:ferrous iron transport protein B
MPLDQVSLTLPTIALIGSPNSGKTTFFNWLTGANFKTVNYAGSTVDCFRGTTLPVYGPAVSVLDTPGIYSLQPSSRDEEVTMEALTQSDAVKAVIVVVDGTQLNRQLYLVRQIRELKLPMVLAITMMDIVKKSGRKIDLAKLSELAECPVVAVDGRLGGGVSDVVARIRILAEGATPRTLHAIRWEDSRLEKEMSVAESWARAVVDIRPGADTMDRLRRFDRYLLHPIWGILCFVLIMGTLFSSIFWMAAPLMSLVDFLFAHMAELTYGLLGHNVASSFIANGVISGIGSVMVFVPQIFILFIGFSFLEDTDIWHGRRRWWIVRSTN